MLTRVGDSCGWTLRVQPRHREASGAGGLSELFLAQTSIAFVVVVVVVLDLGEV